MLGGVGYYEWPGMANLQLRTFFKRHNAVTISDMLVFQQNYQVGIFYLWRNLLKSCLILVPSFLPLRNISWLPSVSQQSVRCSKGKTGSWSSRRLDLTVDNRSHSNRLVSMPHVLLVTPLIGTNNPLKSGSSSVYMGNEDVQGLPAPLLNALYLRLSLHLLLATPVLLCTNKMQAMHIIFSF